MLQAFFTRRHLLVVGNASPKPPSLCKEGGEGRAHWLHTEALAFCADWGSNALLFVVTCSQTEPVPPTGRALREPRVSALRPLGHGVGSCAASFPSTYVTWREKDGCGRDRGRRACPRSQASLPATSPGRRATCVFLAEDKGPPSSQLHSVLRRPSACCCKSPVSTPCCREPPETGLWVSLVRTLVRRRELVGLWPQEGVVPCPGELVPWRRDDVLLPVPPH